MSKGLVFAVYGETHWARITVAIKSIRKHYKGAITVFTPFRGGNVLKFFKEHNVKLQGLKNKEPNLCKIEAMENAPYDYNILLDADILCLSNFDIIFEYIEKYKMTFANFMDFKPTQAFYRDRLNIFLEHEDLHKDALRAPVCIWGPIIGFTKGHSFIDALKVFVESAVEKKSKYAFDISCHLLAFQYRFYIMSSIFCMSSKFQNPHMKPAFVHFHRNRHVIKDCKYANKWMEIYKEDVQQFNIPIKGDFTLVRRLLDEKDT